MHKISREFTFGFEIEGLFSKELMKKLKEMAGSNIRVEAKRDGSVHVNYTGDYANLAYVSGDDDLVTEVTVGVFDRIEDMFKFLAIFENNKNYWQNRSCGLHIHVGYKGDQELRAKIMNFGLMQQLQEFAKNKLCLYIKRSRLSGSNQYCQQYTSLDSAATSLKHGEKYRFMRNHNGYGTFEFRFFAPCPHKVSNAEKFFDYFFELVGNIKLKVSREITLDDEKRITNKLDAKRQTKVLNINIEDRYPAYGLFDPSEPF